MPLNRVLGHYEHLVRHAYDVAWSQQRSQTVLQECGTILPQGSLPIHVGLTEVETAAEGASPDIPQMLYGIEVRHL